MNKEQASILISTTFESTFDEDQYSHFLRELFNGQIDESDERKFDYYGQYIPDSFKDYVRRYKRLGTYTDPDGQEIDLLIVILKRDSALERARTMQRNFAAYHLKRRDKETAIIAYTTEDRADWRFSMVRREPVVSFSESGNLVAKDELTPVRRYSFLVGQSERSHTAQQQLFPILEDDKNDPTLTGLEEAFNIETVTKEFFERYKGLFLQLKEELDHLTAKDKRVQIEFKDKDLDTANFAKKLLGQIVFLYFLQKKGWLGVREGDTWGAGAKDFLSQLFERKWVSYDNFFNDILEPLFYEALASERPDNIYPRLNARIPFLNGGLFEPMKGYKWQDIDILIDNSIFANIFETFDLYNFTVREDEPLEKEVAVDPEMLGKVFENLLEVTDRKSKGAFYTPREIVHYMCQESLINYLDTRVNIAQRSVLDAENPQHRLFDLSPNKNEQLSFTESISKRTIARDDIATFIRVGELAVQNDTAKEAGTVTYTYQMPQSIRDHATKLDDALANIKICDPAIGSGAFPVGMMQEIIKAREVLTTYIGESDSRSLYNFKRQAIQESIYGVDIDPAAIDIAKLRLWLSLVVDEDNYHHIKPLPNLDYKIVCGNSLLSVQKDLFNLDLFKELEILKTVYFDETNPLAKQEQRAEIDALIIQLTGDHSQFDMQIYFSEVFHSNKGFDVVIANPPYVRQERIKAYKDDLKKSYPNVYAGRSDLYVYFYARGFNILAQHGVLTYITPNKFMRANYGKKLRAYLASKTNLHTLIDFGDLPVFDATTYPMIIIACKQVPDENKIKVLDVESLDAISTLYQAVDRAYELPQRTLSGDGWQLSPPEIRALMDKLKASGKSLSEYVNEAIYRGIVTGLNEAFIIDEKKRFELIDSDPKSNELIKPFIIGRDVKRWVISSEARYIIFTYHHVDIEHYPAIENHLRQYKDQLEARATSANHKWYELQQPQTGIYAKFEYPKIIWGNLATQPQFASDYNGAYINAPSNIISTSKENLIYLLGILNSQITQYFIASIGATRAGGFIEYKPMYVSQIPIADAPDDLRQQIGNIAQQCLDVAKDNPNQLPSLENKLNQLVYQAYGLSPGDIALIEGQV